MIRHGFTFVEMCIAMTITAMTGLAIVGFTTVTMQTWSATEHAQQLEVCSFQASTLMTNVVERSRAIGFVSSPTTRVFVWLTDSYGGGADGKAQFAEMALIEYNATLESLILYRADMTAAQSAGGDASSVIATADMNKTSYATLFKTMTWLDAPRTILGPGRVVSEDQDVVRVTSLTVTPVTSSGLPAFEMNATLSRGLQRKQASYVVVVRAPTARPDYANPNG